MLREFTYVEHFHSIRLLVVLSCVNFGSIRLSMGLLVFSLVVPWLLKIIFLVFSIPTNLLCVCFEGRLCCSLLGMTSNGGEFF